MTPEQEQLFNAADLAFRLMIRARRARRQAEADLKRALREEDTARSALAAARTAYEALDISPDGCGGADPKSP